MYEDDIDWVEAASDCGLIALFRDMEALPKPFSSLKASTRRTRSTKPARESVRASAEIVAMRRS